MYAQKYTAKSNVIQLEPPPVELAVGEWVFFMHRDRLISGIVWGTIHTVVQRHLIDGVHPIVCEYIIEPDKGLSPWSYVTVHESDIVWGSVQ